MLRAARRAFRIVAHDHRGHGRGIRSTEAFRLEHCADDVAALARALDLGSFIAVGYSIAGPVAQLLWRRHRPLVDGLVLCATSRTFSGTVRVAVCTTSPERFVPALLDACTGVAARATAKRLAVAA